MVPKKTIASLLMLVLFSQSPLVAEGGLPSPWEPYSATMIVDGERLLVEVLALDESRDHVLATRYLVVDATAAAGLALQIFEPGVLGFEAHAQVSLQLREGDYFHLEMQGRSSEAKAQAPVVEVTISVREGEILARDVGSIVLKNLPATVPKGKIGTPSPWEPYGATLVIDGPRVLVETRAVDRSRHHVLASKHLILGTAPERGTTLQIFEAGVLEHEAHAQVRLQLREGDALFLELPGEIPQPSTVAITVQEGAIPARESTGEDPVGSIVFELGSR